MPVYRLVVLQVHVFSSNAKRLDLSLFLHEKNSIGVIHKPLLLPCTAHISRNFLLNFASVPVNDFSLLSPRT